MNSQKLFQDQFQNNLKTSILMAVTFAIVGVLGYLISLRTGNFSIMYIFLGIGIIQTLIQYWFSGPLAIKFSGAVKADITTPSGSRLQKIVERLSHMADLPTPEVYIIPDENMNAFATGRNKYHAKVAATQGLLHKLNDEELEGVMAHELAHVGNKDILLSSVVALMAGMITHMIYIFASRDDENRYNPIVGILIMLFAPFIGLMIQMAVSRSREFQADAVAVKITNKPQGLMSALEKIHQNNTEPMIHADESMAHMYIANPFSGRNNISKYFMTHPPVEERVERLKSFLN